MRKRNQVFIVTVVLATLIAASAFGETDTCAPGERGAHYKEKKEAIMHELNLTAEQEKLLKDTKAAHREEMAKLRQELKGKRQELKGILDKPGATRQEAEPVVAQLKALQSEMVDQRVNGIFEVKEILTPEQFQKLQERKTQRQEKARMKRGRKE